MNSHSQTTAGLLAQLKTTPEGLTGSEAEKRLLEYGENRLKGEKKKSLLQKFLEQFRDVMVLILLAAAVISFFTALSEGDRSAFFEPFLILLIVVLNSLMGVIQ